jgi:DUF4097 and DUF4098 domain-containing protein YvlB
MPFRRAGWIALGLVLSLAATSVAAETERVHKTVPLAPGGTVRLANFSGRVTIVGTDRAEVVIDAVRKATRDRLDRIKLDVQASGSTVRIDANKIVSSSWWPWSNNVVETDMEIQVPRETNLELHVFSSSLTVTGVKGSHRIHTFSGNARLVDVTGPLKADTFSGNIDVQVASADTRPNLDVHTFSGDIDVRVPASASAQVDFNSFSGDLTSDLPLMLKSKSRRSVRGEINGAGNAAAGSNIYLKTFSGNARIHG